MAASTGLAAANLKLPATMAQGFKNKLEKKARSSASQNKGKGLTKKGGEQQTIQSRSWSKLADDRDQRRPSYTAQEGCSSARGNQKGSNRFAWFTQLPAHSAVCRNLVQVPTEITLRA